MSENEFGAYIYGNYNNLTSYTEISTKPSEHNKETFEYTFNDNNCPLTSKSYFDRELDFTTEYFYE